MRDVHVGFNDLKVKEAFEALKSGKSADPEIYKAINHAIDTLKADPECGIKIPRNLIPERYENTMLIISGKLTCQEHGD
jgi:hypothetical protein